MKTARLALRAFEEAGRSATHCLYFVPATARNDIAELPFWALCNVRLFFFRHIEQTNPQLTKGYR